MNPSPNPLGTENINKLLIKFSIPTIFTILVNNLYNIVDQIFIGKGVRIEVIAATNVAFLITIICIAIALLIGYGSGANISLSLGEKIDKKQLVVLVMALHLFGLLYFNFGEAKYHQYLLTTTHCSQNFPYIVLDYT